MEMQHSRFSAKSFYNTLETIYAAFNNFVDAIKASYPNKRIVHLAFRHGDKKVRKRNMKRIAKWTKKHMDDIHVQFLKIRRGENYDNKQTCT